MLVIKIFGKNQIITDTINNIKNSLSKFLYGKKTSIISDANCTELVVGQTEQVDHDFYVAEILIKKTLKIKKNDITDAEKLDKFIFEINNFISNYEELVEPKYKSLLFRK